jgi:hypothetical protein
MLNSLEDWLAAVYKGSPKLAPATKKAMFAVWPWVALIFGVLQLLAALALWRAGHSLDQLTNTINSLYPANAVNLSHLNVFYWISLVVIVIDGVVLLMAYPKLKIGLKAGWKLLFYGALLNLVYGIFSLFNNYGGFGSLVLQLIVTAIVLYFLFQIRDQYSGHSTPKA